MNCRTLMFSGATAIALAAPALGGTNVIDFEDLAEGFYGTSMTHQGITYSNVNQVSGVFPDGSTFGPQPNEQVIIEDATFFYNDFPGWGSADKTLTFGSSFVPGDNLSLGRVSSVTMDLDSLANSLSMDIGYFENGPWGGIEFHLDALLGGSVVASDSLTIADAGGRDNPQIGSLAVSGADFDQLHLYATYGTDYSLPRILIDDITITSTPAPGVAAVFALAGLRRRRQRAS